MKQIETFFEMSNYDSKNITNKGDKNISSSILSEIETKGATLELLERLDVPVYKYKTQITIHGTFPKLDDAIRLGGYKNVFQNKNLSIGVKWQAVDFQKKERIYSCIASWLKGWRVQLNSTEYFIYKTSDIFRDKETYKTLLEAAKLEVSHIDRTLFFGNCGVYLSQTLYGGYYLVTYINIGGILEKNVVPCIENITGTTIAEIDAKNERIRLAGEEQREQRRKQDELDRQARKEKQQPLIEAATAILEKEGYIYLTKQPIETGRLYINIKPDTDTGCFHFEGAMFFKEQRQKKFRYLKATSNTLEFMFPTAEYQKRETIQTTCSGWTR